MKELKCNCGVIKQVPKNTSFGDIKNFGWRCIYDISNGLTNIAICPKCCIILEKHLVSIEKLVNKQISDLNFCGFLKHND